MYKLEGGVTKRRHAPICDMMQGDISQSPEKVTAPWLRTAGGNFALYDIFEEGFEIFINNPVSAMFLYNATSTMKGIAHLQ